MISVGIKAVCISHLIDSEVSLPPGNILGNMLTTVLPHSRVYGAYVCIHGDLIEGIFSVYRWSANIPDDLHLIWQLATWPLRQRQQVTIILHIY